MHDHGEKILYCKPCGFYEVANGRFGTTKCQGCGKNLSSYTSRQYLIDNVGKEFEAIPRDETRRFEHGGFVKLINNVAKLIKRTIKK